MIIEIQIPEGAKLLKRDSAKGQRTKFIVRLPRQHVQWSRAVWLRSFRADTLKELQFTMPKDGKGLLISQTGRLKKG